MWVSKLLVLSLMLAGNYCIAILSVMIAYWEDWFYLPLSVNFVLMLEITVLEL
jgi:hypothetical protein